MLIAFEGIDGCGKTTIVNRLYDELLNEGYNVRKIKFPTDNNMFGQAIQVWLNWEGNNLHPFAMQLLFALDKYCNLDKLQTKEDEILLADRYTLSALAYGLFDLKQAKGEIFLQDLLNLYAINSYLPKADVIYYIKADPHKCLQRKIQQNQIQHYEKTEQLEEIAKLYEFVIKSLSGKTRLPSLVNHNINIVDGNTNLDDLYTQVKKQVFKNIKEKVRT